MSSHSAGPSTSLPPDIVDVLERVLRDRGGLGAVSAQALRRMVRDDCDRFVVLNRSDKPVAFVALSPPGYPHAVSRAAERAASARDRLGAMLGSAVLTPLYVGESNGASYSITTYCDPVSLGPWRGRLQRWRVGPPALEWLAAVVEHTAAPAGPEQAEDLFAGPLRSLAEHPAIDADVRAAASFAVAELAAGTWMPRTALAHNDYWVGNLVRCPRPSPGGAGVPFFVIDWGGSLTEGHAVYDLVRMAMSLNLGPERIEPVLASHCRALGCEIAQASHYLMSALGYLCENLGEWPVDQFARTAFVCHRFLSPAR